MMRFRWPRFPIKWGPNTSITLAIFILFVAAAIPVLRSADISLDTRFDRLFSSGEGLVAPVLGRSDDDAAVPTAGEGAAAKATLKASPLAPDIQGTVRFHPLRSGTQVIVTVQGLPEYKGGRQPIGPHGFHIHEGNTCEVGDPKDPFASAGGHYNPTNQPHGNHAGDLPVLFSNEGMARMLVYTSKFQVEDIIGKTIVIHLHPDDFRTNPTGNSGPRIACGVIEAMDAKSAG